MDDRTSDEFEPTSAGWEAVGRPYTVDFPEVEGRSLPMQRDFWVRGNDRLIIEWDNPWITVRAVLLNGVVQKEPMSRDEFNQVWK